MLEVELTSHLNLSGIVHRRSYFAEGGRVRKTGSGIAEIRVIESIEEFKAQRLATSILCLVYSHQGSCSNVPLLDRHKRNSGFCAERSSQR